jgi:monoamine oxidase
MVPITRSAGLTLAPSDYSFDTRSIETGTYAPTALKVRADLYDYLSEIEDADPALRWSVAEWLRKEKWDATEPEKSWALNTLITQEYSVDADVLGTHAYLEGKDDRGGDAFVLGGFQRAPETLANDLDVRLNSAVDLVSANKRGVVVRESSGKLWKADIVVVAVPHALLKAGSPRITDLPKKTRRAVAQLRTGNLERVVLRFEEQWWKSFDVTAQGIGLVGARWSEWYDVSANTGVPTLLGFCGGRAAEGMPASDQAAASEAMNELSRGFAR